MSKERLKEVIFYDDPRREDFLSVVFEAVRKDYTRWVKKQNASYLLHEAALVFEAGWHKHLHRVVLVTAPVALCVQRVLQRDPGRSREEVKRIMRHQWARRKEKEADFLVVNDGSRGLIPQVLCIHEALMREGG